MSPSHCQTTISDADRSAFDNVESPTQLPYGVEILRADRSFSNESEGREMFGCVAKDGAVVAFFPSQSAFDAYAARLASLL